MVKRKTKTAYESRLDYTRKNYDVYQISMPKGMREQLKSIARENGKSMNRFILECLEAQTGLKLTLDNALPWMNPETKK